MTDNTHWQIVAATNWALAVFTGDKIEYRGVAAFAIGPQGIAAVYGAQRYRQEYTALVDPISNQFISLDNGRAYAGEADFLRAMKALREFAESPEAPAETVAH